MRTTEWTVKSTQAYLDILEAAGGLEIAINKHAHHRVDSQINASLP